MRRFGGLLLLAFIIVTGISFYRRDELIKRFRSQKLFMPYYKEPNVYDLLSIIEKNGIAIDSPPIIADNTIQATISGFTVYFSQDKDFFSQVRSLQLVLPKVKMEDSAKKIIDLRFSKVVIR